VIARMVVCVGDQGVEAHPPEEFRRILLRLCAHSAQLLGE